MTAKRVWRMAVTGAAAAVMIAAAGWGAAAAQTAQPKPAPKAAPKAAPKKAPVRRVARPKAQTAPTRDRIVEIQQALAREGFYSGTPSGKWDAPSSQAMKNFQTSKGLSPTGKLGAQSLQKLGLGSEIAGKAAPVVQADTRPSVLTEKELDEPEPKEP